VKKYSVVGFFSLCLLFFVGCDKFGDNLVVINGGGGGPHALVETVAISADTPDFGYAFDKWVGDVANIADATAPDTTLVMPAGDAQVEATYKLVSCYLEVWNGSGGGTFSPLQTVPIKASPPPSGSVFDRWVGEVSGIANVTAQDTTITVNQARIRIEASYKAGGASVTPPPPSTPQIPFGTSTAFVSGNKSADGGSTVYVMIGGMDVRLLANDGSKIACQTGWYFISGSIIKKEGAFSVTRLANGDAVVTGRDFTSPNTGLHYQFAGWTVHSSANPLVRQNPMAVASGELHSTLRGYWATVK